MVQIKITPSAKKILKGFTSTFYKILFKMQKWLLKQLLEKLRPFTNNPILEKL
jgi:mRNA-degrading endonuclease RelE of RelBE toxin-antitoxin system